MKFILTLLSLCLLSQTLHALQTQDPDDEPNYVSVHIEIKELKESGKILKESTLKLAETLEIASSKIEELSPEQLILMNTLADKINEMTDTLNKTVTNIPQTIEQAQKPSMELLTQSLIQVRNETVTPITNTLERWLVITVIGLIILGIGLIALFAYCTKHLASMGSTIKEIANGYRVIPVEQYNNLSEKPDQAISSNVD